MRFLEFFLLLLAYAESYRILGIAIVAPPNLLLNSDILDILKSSTLYYQ